MKIIRVSLIVNLKSLDLGRCFYELIIGHRHRLNGIDFQIEIKDCRDGDFHGDFSDLLVVFNTETLFFLKDKVDEKQAIIQICNDNNDRNLPPNIACLGKIIAIGNQININGFLGIPKEMVSLIPLDLSMVNVPFNLSNEGKSVANIRYDIGDEELLIVKKIIRIFNRNPSLNLRLFTTHLNAFILKDLCNDNISFVCEPNRNEFNVNCDMFIGSGFRVLQAIRNDIPAFVLGSHGVGGLVNSENIKDYYRTGFKGRIGGVPGEEVPTKLLDILFNDALHEVEQCRQNNLEAFNVEQIDDLLAFDNQINILRILKIFAYEFDKKIAKVDPITFDSLVVKTFSYIRNIRSEPTNGQEAVYKIVNIETGKLIGALNEDEYRVFSTCHQPTKIKKLYKLMNDFDEETVRDFLVELWENRVIDFVYDTAEQE